MMAVGPAAAHPLGNFTINHLAIIQPVRIEFAFTTSSISPKFLAFK